MRKILLASAAMLTATAGGAFAQISPADQRVVAAPTVQSVESPYAGRGLNAPVSAAGANNNNNIGAAAYSGPTANPTPGTFVIRLGGRVNVDIGSGFSSIDSISTPAIPASGGVATTIPANTAIPAGFTITRVSPTGVVTGTTATVPGVAATGAKKSSTGIGTYMRLYPGLDAMATNGLRYGAGTEIRMNSPSTALGSVAAASAGGSGQSSANTLFVRRAFVYAAGDKWGLLRVGIGDGTLSLFDGGVTTGQNWSNSGVLNGGDAQFTTPGNNAIPFYWMALAGNEYASNKIVYVSPKIFGIEGSVTYTPSAGNLYTSCGVPGSSCSTLSSSSAIGDATRYTDLYQAGLRYLNDIGPVNVRAYGVYIGSGQVSYTGPAARGTVATGNYYNPLSVYNAGLAATYAGFTASVNYIGGAMNGQFVLAPAGAPALNATTAGLQYVTGALTLGVTGAVADSQGYAPLTGKTQLHEQEISFGGRYVVAPGLAVSADYIYQQRRQNGYSFVTSTLGANNNQVNGQAFLLGAAVNW
jgi:hypothetical protein